MTSGFQQQVPTRGVFTRSAPEAQHGKKADKDAVPHAPQPTRSFQPRPAAY